MNKTITPLVELYKNHDKLYGTELNLKEQTRKNDLEQHKILSDIKMDATGFNEEIKRLSVEAVTESPDHETRDRVIEGLVADRYQKIQDLLKEKKEILESK